MQPGSQFVYAGGKGGGGAYIAAYSKVAGFTYSTNLHELRVLNKNI